MRRRDCSCFIVRERALSAESKDDHTSPRQTSVLRCPESRCIVTRYRIRMTSLATVSDNLRCTTTLLPLIGTAQGKQENEEATTDHRLRRTSACGTSNPAGLLDGVSLPRPSQRISPTRS
ncbi:hypothetical protein EXIGLDRAFT_149053 [Exidia glandulosa HHB12029]|uniref:Uncharacterized protein n=1 Tax=Exidia glandulosa HHB12029 TaxID=1314781 RepID=A0A165FMY8_EXIGL|nr:hypothetical protein EXIGLDRAFT_149053 [Exidia glandulosa HHB12029]